ncbi:MAG: RepB family plasmid replication initiator protein, partial [Cetobacterium sp.]
FILNEITKFTKFDLEEFTNLKSSYARNMFRLLKQFDNKNLKECWYQIKLDDLKLMLDIPSSYKMFNIDQRVLFPVLEELKPLFPNLKLEKIKRGVKVDSLKFTWKPKKKQAEEIQAIKKRNSIGEKELEKYQERFEELQEEKNEIDPVEKIEKIKISKVDYEDLYTKYLEENNIKHNTAVKKIFNTMNRSKYEVIEFEQPNLERVKVYTLEDIEPSLLLSKTGKKLNGSILANRIQKILAEMNKDTTKK